MPAQVSDEPGRMRLLRHDKHGRPVPWFVAELDGKPDFRLVRPGAIREALGPSKRTATTRPATYPRQLCWVCGVPFQRQEDRTFVVGPMCVVNRISSEPPSHLECSVFSATHCPFLTTPNMVRRERGIPEDAGSAGVFLKRNPGVTVVWVTRYNEGWHRFTDPISGGDLFKIGMPKDVRWYAFGRPATREEALAAIESGLPALLEAAGGDGSALDYSLDRARELVPAA